MIGSRAAPPSSWRAQDIDFPGLAAVARVETYRKVPPGEPEPAIVRWFLLSTRLSAERLLAVARTHWTIENQLHWVLDVAFDEDRARSRKDHAPQNLALHPEARPQSPPDITPPRDRSRARSSEPDGTTPSSSLSAICDSPAPAGEDLRLLGPPRRGRRVVAAEPLAMRCQALDGGDQQLSARDAPPHEASFRSGRPVVGVDGTAGRESRGLDARRSCRASLLLGVVTSADLYQASSRNSLSGRAQSSARLSVSHVAGNRRTLIRAARIAAAARSAGRAAGPLRAPCHASTAPSRPARPASIAPSVEVAHLPRALRHRKHGGRRELSPWLQPPKSSTPSPRRS